MDRINESGSREVLAPSDMARRWLSMNKEVGRRISTNVLIAICFYFHVSFKNVILKWTDYIEFGISKLKTSLV